MLINRQAAIEAVAKLYAIHGSEGSWIDQKDALEALRGLPSAESDPSDVARDIATIIENEKDMRVIAQPEIVRCKDCKFWRTYVYVDGRPKFLSKCGFNQIYVNGEDFCSRAERRENDKR